MTSWRRPRRRRTEARVMVCRSRCRRARWGRPRCGAGARARRRGLASSLLLRGGREAWHQWPPCRRGRVRRARRRRARDCPPALRPTRPAPSPRRDGGGVIGRAPGSWWMGAGSARARSGGAFEIPKLTSRMVNPYTKGVRRRDSSRHSSPRRRLSRAARAASSANFFLCSSVGFWSFSCSCRDFSQAKSFE